MTSGIERVTVGGAAPRRLRAVLRRDTSAVRAIAADHRSLASVRCPLPEALLGGDLANWMGDSLRRALRFWEPQPAAPGAPSSRARAPVGGDAATRAPRSRSATLAAPRTITQTPVVTAPQGAPPPNRRPRAMPEITEHAARAWATERHPESAPVLSEMAAVPSSSTGRQSGSRMVSASGVRVALPEQRADSPLVRALRSYWQAQQTTVSSQAEPIVAASTTAMTRSRRLGPEDEGERRPAAAVERADTGAFHAAFERGRRSLAPAGATVAAPLADQRIDADDVTLPRQALQRTGAIATDWLTGSLADQLADILREQAIREGVDLT